MEEELKWNVNGQIKVSSPKAAELAPPESFHQRGRSSLLADGDSIRGERGARLDGQHTKSPGSTVFRVPGSAIKQARYRLASPSRPRLSGGWEVGVCPSGHLLGTQGSSGVAEVGERA